LGAAIKESIGRALATGTTSVSENDVRRRTDLPPPSRRRRKNAVQMGGFLLTIPSGVQPASQRQIISAIATMVSPKVMKARIQNGFPVAPRFSVCADPRGARLVAHRQDGEPVGTAHRDRYLAAPADPRTHPDRKHAGGSDRGRLNARKSHAPSG